MTFAELQAEVAHLRDELQIRDQLVQQLSQELFRMVKGNATAKTNAQPSEENLNEMRVLREQLHGVEQQVSFYQNQLESRDTEIHQLRQTVKDLGDRSQMLERVVQEMPQVYRQKFAERLSPIKEKVALIQQENRRLHAELQSVSYRLAVRNRRVSHIDLPSFPRGMANAALPSVS
ncbi:MAG: Npun_F5560 family protein [Cyanobacteria bacterium J06638_22]